ncbi:phosphoglycerate kinase [bacterium]|nr:phosphoglycerate kinase [bacterium]
MKLRRFQDAAVAGARVLVRVDINVPMEDGEVLDDTRIRMSLPTIVELLEKGAQVILASHLGRPKGVRDEKYSLKAIVPVLSGLLNEALETKTLPKVSIKFLNDCLGYKILWAINQLDPGTVILLENTRFHREEKRNQRIFAMGMASLANCFVNDAFGSCHRAHASTEGIAHFRPAYAGYLVQREVAALSKAVEDPETPYYVVLGGAKISGKIDVIKKMLDVADSIFIGGAMAFTFAKALGCETGRSLIEEDRVTMARMIIENATQLGKTVHLPADVVVTDDIENPTRIETKPIDGMAPDDIGVDIGEVTISEYTSELAKAKTIFWNGPMGIFEKPEFAKGTTAIANALASADAVTIVGGGESAMAVRDAGVEDKITHVSTGGGASLEFVGGKSLPGIRILEEDNQNNPAYHLS